MKRIKIALALAAVLTGVGTAIGTTGKPAAKAEIYRNWIDWNNQLVLVNVPQSTAQAYCISSIEVCLRAQDNVYIYTTGFIWE
ncbi:hypothetical protein [Chitinophaga agri]|uniref:Uncharacterized protein n=1 Tax=Chitinophaga agri TaxID=2703787 RepID=A0A6B9ZC45_9BACT|nr:hypothetical protein [Chitinophaga agri]QHS58884.1 hypothetical protein GWR21_04480 [Chitinophaga agri]